MHEHTTIGVDLAKSVFEVAVSDRPGAVSLRRRLTRGQFSSFLTAQAPATIVMEACGTAHFWGRQAESFGHRVILLPPHAVRPYALRNKTDGADARALLEALRNDALRAVPIKTVDQHVLAALHRLRSGWMATRTARLNAVRGLLRELGVAIPVGATRVVPVVRALCAPGDTALPAPLRLVLRDAAAEIGELETRMRQVERSLEALASESALVARLRTVPGVGLLTATALRLRRRRRTLPLRPSLRELPRPHAARVLERAVSSASSDASASAAIPTCACCSSTARSVLTHAKRSAAPRDGLRNWALSREAARGHNKAAVALANKLARIVWAVWRNEQPFHLREENTVS